MLCVVLRETVDREDWSDAYCGFLAGQYDISIIFVYHRLFVPILQMTHHILAKGLAHTARKVGSFGLFLSRR